MDDLIISLFRERLSGEFPGILAEVDAHLERIPRDESPHFALTAMVVAGYQALLGLLPREQALDAVGKAFHEPVRGYIQDGTRELLDTSDDPFTALVDVSKERERDYFGVDFTFVRSVDDEQRYHVDVHRCFYADLLARNGVPELGTVFCEFDAAWIGAVDVRRHGFRFDRPTTIARGGHTCPFHFTRTV
ncbi:MAG: L-2-amino-thiazoline-4-carboxylic acid hydrolase [Umezawaea sp.]